MPRKLSLQRDQRKALLRGLVSSLVLHESITTTEAKAKEVAPYFERLVTKAKIGTLHGRRQVLAHIQTENVVAKLFTELVPAFAERKGGYTRIVKVGNRRGDNAPMAVVQLVLPAKKVEAPKAVAAKTETKSDTPKATKTPKKATAAASKTASKARAGKK